MDGSGALAAIVHSSRMTKKNRLQLVKLDLSFWWYHALSFLIAMVAYLDVLLGILGVELPVDPMVLYFATLAAYCVLQTGLFLWKKCSVDAAYVLAYEQIAYPEPVEVE